MPSYNTHPSVYLNSPNQYKKYQKISYKIFLRYLSVEPGEKRRKNESIRLRSHLYFECQLNFGAKKTRAKMTISLVLIRNIWFEMFSVLIMFSA